jgi:hypothetical protein
MREKGYRVFHAFGCHLHGHQMEAHPDEFQALDDASEGYVRQDTLTVSANMWYMP